MWQLIIVSNIHQQTEYHLFCSLSQASIADFSDHVWVTLFQEQAETLIGKSAQELGTLRDSNPEAFQNALNAVTFKTFTFKLRVKMETYNVSKNYMLIMLEKCIMSESQTSCFVEING